MRVVKGFRIRVDYFRTKGCRFESKLWQITAIQNHALAVASATSGMELILKVFDIKKGDEIITTPYAFYIPYIPI